MLIIKPKTTTTKLICEKQYSNWKNNLQVFNNKF